MARFIQDQMSTIEDALSYPYEYNVDITSLCNIRNTIDEFLLHWGDASTTSYVTKKVTYACGLCKNGGRLTDEESARQHIESYAHRKAMTAEQCRVIGDRNICLKRRYEVVYDIIRREEEEFFDINNYQGGMCRACFMVADSPLDLKLHALSKAHQERLGIRMHLMEKYLAKLLNHQWSSQGESEELLWKVLGYLDANEHITYSHPFTYHCCLCNMSMKGPIPVVHHIQGRIHKSRIDYYETSSESSQEYYDLM